MSDAIQQMAEQATAPASKRERTVTPVEMSDGRTVEFVGKRKLNKDFSISEDGFDLTVTLDFISGDTRKFEISANSPMFARLAAHGALQKLGDEVAGLEDPEDQVIAIEELIERLNKGEWGAERKRGEGNPTAGLSVLAKALVQTSGKSPEAVREFLKSKTNAQKLAMRDNPMIKPIIAELEAKKKQKPKGDAIDSGALLDELTGDE
jgi:hypothetical protein